jgi:hypothetical protein
MHEISTRGNASGRFATVFHAVMFLSVLQARSHCVNMGKSSSIVTAISGRPNGAW